MDELKIVKLAEMRKRMSGIPVKMLLTFLFVAGGMLQFSMERFKEDIWGNIVLLFAIYGIISFIWLCVRLTGNWLIGIIAFAVLIYVWQYNMEKLGDIWNTLIGVTIYFGGLIMDVFTIIRYFSLKKSLFSQMGEYESYEDNEDNEYGDDGIYEKDQRQEAGKESRKPEAPSLGFFSDCKDAASIKRRYRDLCKVYHPDAGNGSSEVFNKITEEYNRLMT